MAMEHLDKPLVKHSDAEDRVFASRAEERRYLMSVSKSAEDQSSDRMNLSGLGKPTLQVLVRALVDMLQRDDSGISFYRLSWSPGGGVHEYVERNTPTAKKAPRTSASQSKAEDERRDAQRRKRDSEIVGGLI